MNTPLRGLLVLILALATIGTSPAQSKEAWMDSYNALLKKYVNGSGVKYAEWKKEAADLQAIQQVVDGIAKANVSSLGKKEQLAFYVNAYNAWILHEALGKYPTKSVKDTFFRFFLANRINVAGQQTSFKKLEDEVIRAKFGNPGVHFALNCASRSCPPLNREAFTGEKLDQQFETLAKAFINSEKGLRYQEASKTAELSAIFKWYKDDFKEGAVAFINQRRSTPIPNDAKITYLNYDWSLNEAK
jgi:hypothetical protein